MVGSSEILQRVEIVSPCTANWDEMDGDDKQRFCGQCRLHVYDTTVMTDEEVLSKLTLIASGQKVCLRMYKRTDGKVMMQDCPIGWRKAQADLKKCGASVAAAVAFAISLLVCGGGASAKDSACAKESAPAKASVSPKSALPVVGSKSRALWHGHVRGSSSGQKKQTSRGVTRLQGKDAKETIWMGTAGTVRVHNLEPWAWLKQLFRFL